MTFCDWMCEKCECEGGLAAFLKYLKVKIPYRTAQKWKRGESQPPFWVQDLIMESYDSIKFKQLRKQHIQKVLDSMDVLTYPYIIEIFQMVGWVEPYGLSFKIQSDIPYYVKKACEELGLRYDNVRIL